MRIGTAQKSERAVEAGNAKTTMGARIRTTFLVELI